MPATEEITIDLDSLTAEERATVVAVAEAGGVPRDTIDLEGPTVPVMAGLIFVTLRRTAPRITLRRCVRLAAGAAGLEVA